MSTAHVVAADNPTIAIIIDDMGNHFSEGRELINLPYPLTLSFLPYRKHTQQLAEEAYYSGKEVMLHIPMANTRGMKLGAGALTLDMLKPEIVNELTKALAAVPHIMGLNNHMGSAFTQNTEAMTWVLQVVAHRPLYFVDSRTIASTVAASVAEQNNIPNLSRDVFLDHEQDRTAIHQQFMRLLSIARKHGTALAIGHPHRETIDYLNYVLPKLDEKGFSMATVSGLWQVQHQSAHMFPIADPKTRPPKLASQERSLSSKDI